MQYTSNGATVRIDDAMKQPPGDQSESWEEPVSKPRTHSLSVSYKFAGYFLTRAMLVGFGIAILLAIIFRFEETTYTHCRVGIHSVKRRSNRPTV